MNRPARQAVAAETLAILRDGSYPLPDGRLVADGTDVLALNFASAKNPGGGFLGGASAQEESLARASGLYATLEPRTGYYDANRRCGTALYTDHMILSPGVPVFRDDADRLLEEPYRVSFVTCPAPNAGAVRANEPGRAGEILPTLRRRARGILGVAAAEGFDAPVLGAWGCGVFQNDPAEVAGVFADLLAGEFKGAFARVAFAVLDGSRDAATLAAFEGALGG